MESIVDGTWGSGPPPAEWAAFTVMRGMRWSTLDMYGRPISAYEQRFCYDFLCIINEHERDQAEKAERRKAPQAGGTGG